MSGLLEERYVREALVQLEVFETVALARHLFSLVFDSIANIMVIPAI